MIENFDLTLEELEEDFVLSLEAAEVVKLSPLDTKNLSSLPGYNFGNKYVCSSLGIIYRIKSMIFGTVYGVPMSPFKNRDGYVEYVLTDKTGKKIHLLAHRVVAGLFLTAVPGKTYVNHKDGNRSNNTLANLEYVNASENMRHSWNYLRKR